ncbi:hypothetical protein COCNU_05G004140 [Cocos nucifera]|uniref:Uncharacterized protein n=1 Tax=Cocos nucifera TaxID=13894 RepID=A0A8K0I9H0_COCNU|nr:hypothetical protein COCNU_05G004140 [Cocos nucifera]
MVKMVLDDRAPGITMKATGRVQRCAHGGVNMTTEQDCTVKSGSERKSHAKGESYKGRRKNAGYSIVKRKDCLNGSKKPIHMEEKLGAFEQIIRKQEWQWELDIKGIIP